MSNGVAADLAYFTLLAKGSVLRHSTVAIAAPATAPVAATVVTATATATAVPIASAPLISVQTRCVPVAPPIATTIATPLIL